MRKLAHWPHFSQAETQAVTKVLDSGQVNYWTGEQGKAFEAEFAEYIGVKYAVAVANGTLALECALKAIGLQAGDEVIVPCHTFIATASAVVACQGRPVVADVDWQTQNITLATIQAVISKRTKAIIVVHMAGLPCDMDPILAFAATRQCVVIEDCAQAHGALYKGRQVGSLGNIAAFSFCQDKIMTTGGEGGMLVTNSQAYWHKAWSYKDHGKNFDIVYQKSVEPGFRWLHTEFGSNFRLTEMQAAIGRIQLGYLPDWLTQRRQHAQTLLKVLQKFPSIFVYQPPADIQHAYYKFYVMVKPDYLQVGWDRDRILTTLSKNGVPCGTGCCGEIYKEKAFMTLDNRVAIHCPNGAFIAKNSLMFQVHPTLSHADIQWVAEKINAVMQSATTSIISSQDPCWESSA